MLDWWGPSVSRSQPLEANEQSLVVIWVRAERG